MKKQLLSTVFTTALCFGLVFTISGHKKNNDKRSIAACKDLKPHKQAECVRCLAKAKEAENPHHYHPRAPRELRCRPNNGKP